MGVGIFPRHTTVAVAQLGGRMRRPRLRAVAEVPREGGTTVADLLRERGVSSGQLVLVLPTRSVTVRKTSVPLTHEAQLRRTMKFHAERLIPGLAPEEVVVDYHVTRQEKEHTELLLVVAKKADMQACIAGMGLNGNAPRTITVQFAALFNLLAQGKAFDGAAHVVVVDTSSDDVSLLHVVSGTLQAVRVLAAGAPGHAGERIAREIAYTLSAAGGPARPDRVILAGPPREGIECAGLSRALGCETVAFDVFAHVRGNERVRIEAARMLVPVGAALETLGAPALALNLAREDSRYRTPYEQIRKPILLCAIVLLVVLAAAVIQAMETTRGAARYLDSLQKQSKALYAKVVPSGKPKFSASFHKDIEKIAKQKAAAGTAGQEWLSFLDFLKVLSEHLPADQGTVIQSVAFRGQKVTIRGEARDTDSFETLARSLEKAGKFDVRTPFRLRSGRPNAPARLAFTIELSPRSK